VVVLNTKKNNMKNKTQTYQILLAYLIHDLQKKVAEQTDSPLSCLYANIPAEINRLLSSHYLKELFPLVYEQKAIDVNSLYCGWRKQFSKSYRLCRESRFDYNKIYITSIRGNKYLTFESINDSSKRVNAVSCAELLDLLERKDNIISVVKDYVNHYVQSVPDKDSSNNDINDFADDLRNDIEETENSQQPSFDEEIQADSLSIDEFDNILDGLVEISIEVSDNKSMKFTSMQDIINNLKSPSVSVLSHKTEEEIEIEREKIFKYDLCRRYGNFILEERPFAYNEITRFANF